MKTKLDTALRIAAALVGAAAPFTPDPTIAGLVLAAVQIAIAVNAMRKDGRSGK